MLTYTDIVSAALDYADRADDVDVVNRMSVFLRTVEARINRTLQTGRQTKRAHIYTTQDSTFYALPSDFAGMRNIVLKENTLQHGGIVLEYVTPEVMAQHINNELKTGVYTITACSLQIWPVLNSKVLEITYYQQVPPLTAEAPTNWLTIISPDAYIQGLLVEISSFAKDQEAVDIWDTRFKQTLVDMQFEDDIDRWSGPTPVVRVL